MNTQDIMGIMMMNIQDTMMMMNTQDIMSMMMNTQYITG